MIPQIAQAIRETVRTKTTSQHILLPLSSYITYPITPNIFKQFSSTVFDSSTLFIDGGINTIVSGSATHVSLVRIGNVAATANTHSVKMQSGVLDFYLILSFNNSLSDLVNVQIIPASTNKTLDYPKISILKSTSNTDFTLHSSQIRALKKLETFSAAANYVRQLLEISFANYWAQNRESNSIIVLDGSLEEKEDMHDLYTQLYETCAQKNILVCAIAKSCSLIVSSGEGLIPHLASIMPQTQIWYADNLMRSIGARHRAITLFAKLNRQSKHILRIDIHNAQTMDIPKLLGLFTYYSSDAVFLGYPYPLIKVDQLARVTDEEISLLQTQLLHTKGVKEMLGYDMSSQNAHSILDNIRF